MTKIVSLNEGWRFTALGEPERWVDARVPGDVNADLFHAGILPDPHIAVQFAAYYPNSAKRWLYRTAFDAPKFAENAELVFEGITGAAEIRLNGETIGTACNAHYPHRFEVGKKLRAQGNCLEVEFEAIETSVGAARRDAFGWGNERTMLRTPPFNFGWDWAIPVPSTGLSGKVYFECDNALKFVNVNYETQKNGRADFFFEVSRAARLAGYEIRLHVFGHGADLRKTVPGSLPPGHYVVEEPGILSQHRTFTSVTVPDVQLWEPNGYGTPALYQYEVELVIGGQVVDKVSAKMGFRTVRIAENPFRESSGPGFSYEIVINDVPIFIKGANWIPTELWPGAAKEEPYRRLLQLTRDAGFNMLRVWGGGIYETDLFYDLCDEYGIMVWQDFMFASNAYPVGLLREEIKTEAEYQLKRLRTRPCIVHWCGINEDVFSWAYPGCGKQIGMVQADLGDYSGTGAWQLHDDPEIYSMILRGLESQLGNHVPYIESSPASRGDCGNLPQSGNCHLCCRSYVLSHDGAFREHFDQFSSFNSEFGIQGPDYASETRRFLGAENCASWPPPDPEVWVRHLQRGGGSALWEQQARGAEMMFGPITTFEQFIQYAQASQFELTRAEFEYRRAERPDCGGTMMWMLNDCWPTGNWSLIDFAGRPKPVYYAAKRACTPLLPIIAVRRKHAEFFFSNESARPVTICYRYGLMDLAGRALREARGEATVPANTLHEIAFWNLVDDVRNPGDHYFLAVEGFAVVRCFADGWKKIVWPQDAAPTLAAVRPGVVKVSAGERFVRMAHLAPKDPGVKADFSDNYFDLGPGESCEVTVTPALAPEALKLLHWESDWE